MTTSFLRRAPLSGATGPIPSGAKAGANGTLLVSTGLADLDKALGGGVALGRLLIVIEDLEAPHHLLLLRYFMAQGVSHSQAVLFGSSLAAPKSFLGTLPSIVKSSKTQDEQQPEALRIAWQYRKYDGAPAGSPCDTYTSCFDLRKTCDAASVLGVECLSFQDRSQTLDSLVARCSNFVSSCCSTGKVGRIALQSLCAPQCMDKHTEWQVMSLLLYLKSLLRNANVVALVTIPASLLLSQRRWEHLADTLLSVKALPEAEQSVVDDREATGLLQVDKLPSLNTQVPSIPSATAYAVKIQRKKEVVLEQLQLAPLDAGLSSCKSSSPALDY